MRVLVIWEPMLATDWSKPGTAALSRVADQRAMQFWDKGHLFAQELRHDLESRPGQPDSDCCDQLPQDDKGIVWDLVALFPAGARWVQPGGLPRPVFIGGAAFRMKDRLEKSLAAPVSGGVPGVPVGGGTCALLAQIEAKLASKTFAAASAAAPRPSMDAVFRLWELSY